jgi:hypothetical protein
LARWRFPELASAKTGHLQTLLPLRLRCAISGARFASISAHSIRVASTASAWRRSIIESGRARKKWSVDIVEHLAEPPRDCAALQRKLGAPDIALTLDR